MITFRANGIPIQKGSKRAFQPGWKPGQMHRPAVVLAEDSHRDLKGWMEVVKFAALAARPRDWQLLDGAVYLDATFYMPRPKAHFDSKGILREAAPEYHIIKPDRDKLLRAICDALSGVIWTDDCRVADGPTTKMYTPHGGDPGVRIHVEAR